MKKNKKGFTLVEILITISIIILLSVAGFITFNKISTKQKEKEYNRIIKTYESAAEVWLSKQNDELELENYITKKTQKYKSLSNAMYNNAVYQTKVTIEELEKDGLVENDKINPKTGEEFKDTDYVRLYYDYLKVEGNEAKYKTKAESKGVIAEYMGDMSPKLKSKKDKLEITVETEGIPLKGNWDNDWKNWLIENNIYFSAGDIFLKDGNEVKIQPQEVSISNLTCVQNKHIENREDVTVNCSVKAKIDGTEKDLKTSFNVKWNSIMLNDLNDKVSKSEEGTEVCSNVDLTRTYRINTSGAAGHYNGDLKSLGAAWQIGLNLTQGDKICVTKGKEASILDGNNSTKNAGGGATKITVNGELVFSAAGGAGGNVGNASNDTTIKLGNVVSGGAAKSSDSSVTAVTAKKGTDGINGDGSGAGNIYNTCKAFNTGKGSVCTNYQDLGNVSKTNQSYPSSIVSSCTSPSDNGKAISSTITTGSCTGYSWNETTCTRTASSCSVKSGSACGYTYSWGSWSTNSGSSYPGAGSSSCDSSTYGNKGRQSSSCTTYSWRYRKCNSSTTTSYSFGSWSTKTGTTYPGNGVSTCNSSNVGEYNRSSNGCVEAKFVHCDTKWYGTSESKCKSGRDSYNKMSSVPSGSCKVANAGKTYAGPCKVSDKKFYFNYCICTCQKKEWNYRKCNSSTSTSYSWGSWTSKTGSSYPGDGVSSCNSSNVGDYQRDSKTCTAYSWSERTCGRSENTCTVTDANQCGYNYYFGSTSYNTGSSYPGDGASSCSSSTYGQVKRSNKSCTGYLYNYQTCNMDYGTCAHASFGCKESSSNMENGNVGISYILSSKVKYHTGNGNKDNSTFKIELIDADNTK